MYETNKLQYGKRFLRYVGTRWDVSEISLVRCAHSFPFSVTHHYNLCANVLPYEVIYIFPPSEKGLTDDGVEGRLTNEFRYQSSLVLSVSLSKPGCFVLSALPLSLPALVALSSSTFYTISELPFMIPVLFDH